MIEEVINNYDLKGEVTNININSSGIVHNTYIVTLKDGKKEKKYLLQKINTVAFTKPKELMKNIENVTSYLQKEMKKNQDKTHQTMEILKTKDNKPYVVLKNQGEKEYYRMYKYIDNTISFDASKDENIIFNVAKAFGNFQKYLSDYPIDTLYETIKDFHNTRARYDTLMKDYQKCTSPRKKKIKKEINFIKKREGVTSLIMEKLGMEIPYRVTHNDTKVNNVLLDSETLEFKAVIDLDTVMPGSMLFDYGDGVRSNASNTLEDEKDLNVVSINLDLFKSFTDGFMSEIAPCINPFELDLMAESIRVITLELAIRFLDDYINDDVYFKINYKEHNLDRARCQLALVKDIENKLEIMQKYIKMSYNKYMS